MKLKKSDLILADRSSRFNDIPGKHTGYRFCLHSTLIFLSAISKNWFLVSELRRSIAKFENIPKRQLSRSALRPSWREFDWSKFKVAVSGATETYWWKPLDMCYRSQVSSSANGFSGIRAMLISSYMGVSSGKEICRYYIWSVAAKKDSQADSKSKHTFIPVLRLHCR